MKQYLIFTGKFIVSFLISYLIFGTLFFIFITSDYYGEGGAFSSFLIGESDGAQWDQVRLFMIPIQIVRAILLASVLYPFYEILLDFTYKKRLLILWGYLSIVTGFASGIPAPGNLEGLLFMKPVVSLKIHLEIFAELILQGILFSIIFSKWIAKKAI